MNKCFAICIIAAGLLLSGITLPVDRPVVDAAPKKSVEQAAVNNYVVLKNISASDVQAKIAELFKGGDMILNGPLDVIERLLRR